MTWIMLNPSTADAFADDPTIRRCASFARREGCGGIKVVNLFALRATDPRELRRHPDPVGACNDRVIDAHARGLVVVAWGAGGALGGRDADAARILEAAGVTPVCLGVTAGGQPRHPLYVRGDTPLVPWRPAAPPSPENAPIGSTPPSGRGSDAASEPIRPAPAAAKDAAPDPGGILGTPGIPAGACHPLAPAGTESAPGHPSRPGAERGQVELPQAPVSPAARAVAPGGQGTPPRTGQRDGNSRPGATTPGAALDVPQGS